ncbi:hypothetical protein K7X08_021509 [Anisodus acutangulus]|uniref:Uncharacterized protein n=1 Tax=Anisodus acutangulus TaxID=402998 RepID=A0A9Q1M847_9SOLA|nr:hypothetical protein K7X08_021509 [Anisodus acutangulus]
MLLLLLTNMIYLDFLPRFIDSNITAAIVDKLAVSSLIVQVQNLNNTVFSTFKLFVAGFVTSKSLLIGKEGRSQFQFDAASTLPKLRGKSRRRNHPPVPEAPWPGQKAVDAKFVDGSQFAPLILHLSLVFLCGYTKLRYWSHYHDH